MLVEVRNLIKTYRDAKVEVPALRGVNLTIEPRKFAMIVGASGSGKTTLLNILGCVDRPTSGEVFIDGVEVGALADRDATRFRAERIGYIFQTFNLVPVLSAFENVEYVLRLTDLSPVERRERTLQALEAVGVADQRDQRPGEISGGQRQRVAIARALVKRPALVLADEPTANLDSRTGEMIIDLMAEMQQRFATTFIFSTHDRNLIRRGEQVITISDGRALETAGALS
ncbi:ABC transporter [Caulobacter sp. Root1455]|uniref:ABC transporter ATP-binding protein n=1 Tax=unclassified Caulobacter TaxID=2648921 RepID=UPI0006F2532C|nr:MULTISPECIES: ABC transporter ATP-binding protein [unclassified Caulobacter]KQY26175.1 ABC transporter [Caulobacter sp. Root487D2Y]KQY98677.1 ABC transporter [Caulobacter sp. Root1455]